MLWCSAVAVAVPSSWPWKILKLLKGKRLERGGRGWRRLGGKEICCCEVKFGREGGAWCRIYERVKEKMLCCVLFGIGRGSGGGIVC